VGVKIVHISTAFPNKEFTNSEYFSLFPEQKDNPNLAKIGIESRKIVETETASDLAIDAAQKLVSDMGVSIDIFDFLIFCSPDLDFHTPATASYIHGQLNLEENCGAIDITHGCSGFLYSLSIAKALIESGQCENILLLNASAGTKKIHSNDKAGRYLFGDGAAATWVSSSDVNSIGNFQLCTRGKSYNKIIIKSGGMRHPLDSNSGHPKIDQFGNITSDNTLFMDNVSVFHFSMEVVPALIKEVLSKNKLSFEEIDYFVFHQANGYLLELLRKKMNIENDRFINDIRNIGNTVSATIPIALAQLFQNNQNLEGKIILLAGFGTGLSWGGTIIRL